jgi:DnaJ family protein A protein 2
VTGKITSTRCQYCRGAGFIEKLRTCNTCHGKNSTHEKKFKFVIPKGYPWEQPFVFPKEAGLLGDLHIQLRIVNWNGFKRCRNDLYKKVTLTLQEALIGFNKVLIDHMDGRQLKCKHSVKDGVIKPGTVRSIRGEGMPYSAKDNLRGDLYIEFEINFPDNIITPQNRECNDPDDAFSMLKLYFLKPVLTAENGPVKECELHKTLRTSVSFIYIDSNARLC